MKITKIIQTIWRFAPHLLITICSIASLSGIVTALGPKPPPAPVSMAVSEIQRTPYDALPAWIRTEGDLDWTNAIAVVREKKSGEVVDYERVVVPLTGPDGLPSNGSAGTLLLVTFQWNEFRSLFPRLAAEVKADGGISREKSPWQVTFSPEKASVEFAFGFSRKVLDQFQSMGFGSICAVRPGSKPLTPGDGVGIAVTMLAGVGAGIYWLRKRRRVVGIPVIPALPAKG
jgi:hypothetical protein